MATTTTPEPLDLLIVGAGFAGLYGLHQARRHGLSARVLEAAGGVGGTWYHNRYPGARVDIQSMEYSFSFDDELQQSWHWNERYSPQPELLRYANHIADRYGLRDGIRLNTRVTGARFDEAAGIWQVEADTGERWAARFVVMATGPLSSPNTPHFEGLDEFEGPVYHTGRWPHEPVDFRGKRVGIIGTGSSGVQVITTIAPQVAELTVFQRTAAYAVPAHNGPLDPEYETKIKADYPGFRARNRQMRGGFGSELPPYPASATEVSDELREELFEARWKIGGFAILSTFTDILVNPRANELAAEFVRRKIRAAVSDPRTAELLCPRQTVGCKRLCVDTGYYEKFNQPNVRLVDIASDPIERIMPRGLKTRDAEYRFDELVLATGFDAMTGSLTRLDVRGRDGVSIRDAWQAGPVNYLGLMIHGFPNLFNIVGPGSTSAFTNVIVAIEQHIDWAIGVVDDLKRRKVATIEPDADAQARWVEQVNTAARRTLFLTCNSWYLGANIPGKTRMFMPYAGGFPAYAQLCAEVVKDGYRGFELSA
ncbi:MAG TPA: NAD(P)/FAD-dependent oxidoreductase [Burkholderiaceae bacterium]|nr:NAD(P)/FAD-dependent oxidoreductase [Burkholderiaceae bacterium]